MWVLREHCSVQFGRIMYVKDITSDGAVLAFTPTEAQHFLSRREAQDFKRECGLKRYTPTKMKR